MSFSEKEKVQKKGFPFNTFIIVALGSKPIRNRHKWACEVKIVTTMLTHTTYFKGIRTTTQFHISQLTWYSSYWNESMSKKSRGGVGGETSWTLVGKTKFTSMFNIHYCNCKNIFWYQQVLFFPNVWNTQLPSWPDIWLSCKELLSTLSVSTEEAYIN